jgi:hypothetical protein
MEFKDDNREFDEDGRVSEVNEGFAATARFTRREQHAERLREG